MDSDTVGQHIDTERSRLTDLVEALPKAAWRPAGCPVGRHRHGVGLRVRPGAAGAHAHPPITMTGRATGSTGSAPPPAAAIPEEGR
jgi:hypothetical protein